MESAEMEVTEVESALLTSELLQPALSESLAEETMLAEPVPEPVARMAEVEVKRWHGTPDSRVYGWQRMPIREALRLQEDSFRCPECLGRVRLRAASAEKGLPNRGEHYSKNPGCSLGDCFDGEKRLHIKPLN